MSPEEGLILGAEKVIDRFGRWPGFGDAEVSSLVLSRDPKTDASLEVTIRVSSYFGSVAPSGPYRATVHVVIRLRCEGLTNNEFGGFNNQNVLTALMASRVEDAEGSRVQLQLVPCYGLGATIRCVRILVVDVLDAAIEGHPAGEG